MRGFVLAKSAKDKLYEKLDDLPDNKREVVKRLFLRYWL